VALLDLFSEVKREPVECQIELEGKEIDDLYPALVEVTVAANRKQWTTATLIFETRRYEDGTWVIQDDDRIKPWAPIKITAVFGSEDEEVMRGYVREVKVEYPEDKGAAKVTIICQDESLLLDRVHVNHTWGDSGPVTDGSIASDIALNHNLTMIDTPGEGQTVEDLNQNTTDVRFLKKRADANGYEVIFREGQIYFGDMRLGLGAQPTILVYAGTSTNCISFNIQDDGHQPDKVAYQLAAEIGPDNPAQEVVSNLDSLGNEPADSTSSGLGDFVWRPQRQGISDDAQMAAIAQKAANDAAMSIKVNGELDGAMYGHVLRVGEPVGVDGLGERYSGVYYVDEVSHRFDVNGYKASFKLLRNAYGDNL
jgi:hypothetical protein